jgi:polyisoprenyl-phosphate glycosyltransferase
MTTPLCSLIIPVYKNEESLPELVAACSDLCKQLSLPLEVVFVVDGSPDASADWLAKHLPKQQFASQLCLHSRNFGSFAAIRTGMHTSKGAFIAIMAADLQEPISLAKAFFEILASDKADVTIGTREGRNDPLYSSLSARLFWRLYRKLVIPDIPEGGVDMFGCTSAVAKTLLSLSENNSSLIGQIFWIGYRRIEVPYLRQARKHGVSAWTLSRKIKYLLDSVYSFSDLPIRLLKWLGSSSLFLAMFTACFIFIAKMLGLIDVPGYAATVLTVIFFGGLNALGLGVIGEYVWRTYENTKSRPLAIVASHQHFPIASERSVPQ